MTLLVLLGFILDVVQLYGFWEMLDIMYWHYIIIQNKGFTDSSVGKEFACNTGDPGSIPGLRSSAGEEIRYPVQYSWASLVALLVKNPPAMWKTWVCFLGWEDPLEVGKATHSVFWPGEFHGLWNHKESDTTERFHSLSYRIVYWPGYSCSTYGSLLPLPWTLINCDIFTVSTFCLFQNVI